MRMQEIAEAIKTLSPTDRDHLRKLLKEQDETDKLEVFHQVLLSKGLVKEVKKPHVPDTIKRQLIEVKGKPVSQTIVEERK
ncbi:hypothetical protein F4Y59_12190 [Candidatus Poribacteria bacterium]|nr:hypothetical protein [Candidatus Poribacteria bacterium]MYK19644.1 hypothetical protein [Candidatus Poribacteria bacterium]